MENTDSKYPEIDNIFYNYNSGIVDEDQMSEKIQEIVSNIEFSKDEATQSAVFEKLNYIAERISEFQESAENEDVKEKLDNLVTKISFKASPITTIPPEVLQMTLAYTRPEESEEFAKDMQKFGYTTAINSIQMYFDEDDPKLFDEIKRLAGIEPDMTPKEQYQKLWSLLLKKLALALDITNTSYYTNRDLRRSLRELIPNPEFAKRIPFLPDLILLLKESDDSLLHEENYYLIHNIIDDEVRSQFVGDSELEGQIDQAGYIVHNIMSDKKKDLKDLIKPLKQINDFAKEISFDNPYLNYFETSFQILERDDYYLTNRQLAEEALKGQPVGTYLFRTGSYQGTIVFSCVNKKGGLGHILIKYDPKKKAFFVSLVGGKTINCQTIDDILQKCGEEMILNPISKDKVNTIYEMNPREKALDKFKMMLKVQERDDFIEGSLTDLKIMIQQSDHGNYLITKSGSDFRIVYKFLNKVRSLSINISDDLKLLMCRTELENLDVVLEYLALKGKLKSLELVTPIENRSDYSDKSSEEIARDLVGKPVGTYVLAKSSTVPYSYKLVFVKKDNQFMNQRLKYDQKSGKFIVLKRKYSSFKKALKSVKRLINREDKCECQPLLTKESPES